MIASIKKCTTFSNIIDYHFEKIDEGKAQLLYNGLFSDTDTAASVNQTLEEHFSLFFKESLKYKAYHIALTLPQKEGNVSDDKFKEIAKRYLLKMGFKDCPFIVFRHKDKSNDHIHIIVSTVDSKGKTVEQYNDFYKSQKVSREIEKEFGLLQTEYDKNEKTKSLNELNFRKYYLHNAIKKASRNYASMDYINKMLTETEKGVIYSKGALTQKQLESILGNTRYDNLYNHLLKKGFFHTYYKKELMEVLDSILPRVNTFDDYIRSCHKMGIYARVNFSPTGRPFIKYRLPDHNHYFKDISLDGRFRFDYLSEKFKYKHDYRLISRTQEEQKEYLRKTLLVAKAHSGDFEGFKKYLSGVGVETITYESDAGVYRIKYQDITSRNPFPIEGSILDESFGYERIKEHYNLPEVFVSSNYDFPVMPIQEGNEEIYIPEFSSLHPSSSPTPDNKAGKKKRKKKFSKKGREM